MITEKATELSSRRVREIGQGMVSILGLVGPPVGVRLLKHGAQMPASAQRRQRHRYCKAVMKARHGAEVALGNEGLSCPATASAFGFRLLPNKLRSGEGLVGFGIVADPAVARKIFDDMPHLQPGTLELLHLFPLGKAQHVPDVVAVVDEVEKLMWIALAYLHATGGERVHGTTAILQAVCADSTIVRYLEQRLYFGYGCYGCRDASDIGPNDTVVGFSISLLQPVYEHLTYRNEKAIPASRSTRALAFMTTKEVKQERTSGREELREGS